MRMTGTTGEHEPGVECHDVDVLGLDQEHAPGRDRRAQAEEVQRGREIPRKCTGRLPSAVLGDAGELQEMALQPDFQRPVAVHRHGDAGALARLAVD
jgi:hypothetical protein